MQLKCKMIGSISGYNSDRFKYPTQPPVRMVLGKDVIKYAINLSGECTFMQSNLIMSMITGEEISYAPVVCSLDGSTICRATLGGVESSLRSSPYNIRLLLVTKEDPHKVLEWDLGTVDFSSSSEGTKSTADQKEDIFVKMEEENRPPFSVVLKPDTGIPLSIAFTMVVLCPWIYLMMSWSRLGMLLAPVRIWMALTISQKAFHLSFIAWLSLAIANWTSIDTFATIKIVTILAPLTFIIGLKALRDSLPPVVMEEADKKQK